MKHPYPRYRPSGVEWLGDVPEHWELVQLGRLGSFFKGGGSTKEDEVEGGVPCIRYGDLYTQHQYLIRQSRAGIAEVSASRYKRLRYGDLLFAGSGETIEEIGKSAVNLIEGPAYCGGDVIGFRPDVEIDATFFGYAADSSPAVYQKACMGRGVTVMHIYGRELKHLLTSLPPLQEQRAIAAFLDREIAKVDTLVAKNHQLIERLTEYRVALITRTVTKGLPPDVAESEGFDPSPRLKPSGVEWLGDVPEHWQFKRLKFVASTNDESLSETEDPLRTITYVDIGSVDSTVGVVQTEEMVFEDAPSRARRLVRDGDTIISTVRTYLRAIAPICDPPPEMVVSTGFAVIRPRGLDSRFATWALREHGFVQEIVARSTGVSYPAINAVEIENLPIPSPPPVEQQAIAAFLDCETELIDALSSRVEAAIERLAEYRTALITAAVTGKIDVRDYAAVETEGSAA